MYNTFWFEIDFYIQNSRKDLKGATLEEDMRNQIEMMLQSEEGVVGYQLSPKVFAVKAPVSSMCPLGFVHVYKTDMGKLECGFR